MAPNSPAKKVRQTGDGRSTKLTELGAEQLTPAEQKRRLIEAIRKAGASESEFDNALGEMAKQQD
ncbi:hypothetical protein [Enterovirga rhinocerotis]|uniref:hypothetical protein n=1 Tax=Enterovirga rhinocerotis TaxID=1339210 RepID=UPI00105F2E7C|nr:hypothetical protein [Enterovirga rhinocerotis]